MIVFKFGWGNLKCFQHSWSVKLLLCIFGVCCLFATTYIASRLSSLPMKSFLDGKNSRHIMMRQDLIQILIVTEKNRITGALSLVNSIISNTESPVHFYFVTDLKSSSELHSWIENSVLHDILYEIKIANLDEFNINSTGGIDGSLLDYSIVHIPKLFPQAHGRLIILNDDIIVQGDIATLNNVTIEDDHLVALSTDCDMVTKVFSKSKSKYYNYLNLKSPLLKSENIDGKKCVFNMGVMVVNMTLWKEENVSEKLLRWIDLNKREKVFLIDSVLSPFLIVFNDRISPLDSSWHIRHLGVTSGTRYSRKYLEKANLLHWDGHFKPWKHKTPYTDLWQKYSVSKPKLKSSPSNVE